MNERALELIRKYEGYSEVAYKCPAGVWTIGYGHTKGVVKGSIVDRERAEEYLAEDYEEAEKAVLSMVTQKLTSNQLGALVSFVFNLGAGNFRSSTLKRKINANPNDETIANEFMRWRYAHDGDGNIVELAGLKARREAEADLYFGNYL